MTRANSQRANVLPSSAASGATPETTLRLTTPRFHFRNLIHSHGWRLLAPFAWDETTAVLTRPLHRSNGGWVHVSLQAKPERSAKQRLFVTAKARLDVSDRPEVRRQVERMCSLQLDLTEFHALCRRDPLLAFVHRTRSGRMLRAPTAFEDLVKTICTTNCDWRNTINMCRRLCELGEGSFPAPRQILRYSPARLARKVPLGYRSRTVHALAKLTEDGRLPLDEWAAAGQFERVRETLGAVWGVGPYALSHMLVMLGDYSTIPVDCEVLRYLQAAHFNGRQVSAAEAVRPYEPFGRWRYLAFKFGRMARKMNFSRHATSTGQTSS